MRAILVGFGQMGRHHARVLDSMEQVEFLGVVDPVVERCAFPIIPSLKEALRQHVDIAVVAVPTAAHEEVALTLANAGVHTLIEKPVAPNVEASARMAQAFERAGVVGCVGHIERYNPAIRELRRRLALGELGDIYQILTRRQGPFPERIDDVGVILDLATHDIDLTAWVSDSQYADLSVRTAHRSGRENEDLVAAVGRLKDGTVVSHLVNWLSPYKERVTIVSGERGCFVADTLTADLTFFANGVEPVAWDNLASFRGVVVGDVTRYAIAKQEPLIAELEAFRDTVLGHRSQVVTIAEAAQVVAVAAAMLKSADSSATEKPECSW